MADCVACGASAPGRGRDFCNDCWWHIQATNSCPNCGGRLVIEAGPLYPQVIHPEPPFQWTRPLCPGPIGADRALREAGRLLDKEVAVW